MKHNLKQMLGFAMGATDGEMGKVKDFYFDDSTWIIRYVIVETGNWLSGRKVLIAPQAISAINWSDKCLPVNLNKNQIKNSPDIDTEKPVTRQHEMELYEYYPWNNYWGTGLWSGGMGTSGMMMPPAVPVGDPVRERNNVNTAPEGDPHLRSFNNVIGYKIRATDDEIGDADDFLLDESNWTIDKLVIDTGSWLSGKKVLISTHNVQQIEWETMSIVVDLSTKDIEDSPEYHRD